MGACLLEIVDGWNNNVKILLIRILHLILNGFGYILDQIQINLATGNMESPYKNISEQILKGL